MIRHILTLGLLLLTTACVAQERTEIGSSGPQTGPASHPTMAKLKSLVGTWVAADENNEPTDQVVSVIKLTAGGSVVHETLFPGQPQEMVSVYAADGDDVVMTHYCVLGNQPRMKAAADSPENVIRWVLAGGTNLDPSRDKHMHGATLTMLDADHLTIEGVVWENGGPSPETCETMHLVRKR